jgi:hypothetical protein
MSRTTYWQLGLFVASLSVMAFGARAQCATGVNTGGGNCVPPDAPGMPDYRPPENAAPAQPPPVWEDSWGAIVLDAKGGAKGVATDKRSKDEAIGVAMAECQASGAANCKVELTYHNQCAAVAWGDASLGVANNPSAEGASTAAKDACSRGGTGCKTVYTACSTARRID